MVMISAVLVTMLATGTAEQPAHTLEDLLRLVPVRVGRFDLEAIVEHHAGATAGGYKKGDLTGLDAIYVFTRSRRGPVLDKSGRAIPVGGDPDLLRCPERHNWEKPVVLSISSGTEARTSAQLGFDPCESGQGAVKVVRLPGWCASIARNVPVVPGGAAFEAYWDYPWLTVTLTLGGPAGRLRDALSATVDATKDAGAWMKKARDGSAGIDWKSHDEVIAQAKARFDGAPRSSQICPMALE